MQPGRVCVIGAGVVGASSAYWLARRGWDVTLIDRGRVGAACSHGNCGYICPSHVFPLAKPGAMASMLPLLFKPNSAFKIRLRFAPALWGFLARFAACCHDTNLVHQSAQALHDLLIASKRDYQEMIRDAGIDAEWQALGCLFISRTQHHLEAFEGANREIQDRFGYSATRLDGRALASKEPTLRDDLAGAWYFDCDAHVRPDRFMSGLHAVLQRMDVRIIEGCSATSFEGEASRVRRVLTAQGPIDADAFVVATGAWTGQLSGLVGCRLPIEPGKGYSLTFSRPASCPTLPMIFEEDRVAVTPFDSGFRLGSMMEFAGFDDSIRPERLRVLTRVVPTYFKDFLLPPDPEPWFGWRPMTPDGRPYIGVSPKWSNVTIAAGHNMIGMSTGPGTGRLVAELVSGDKPSIDAFPFRLDRVRHA